MLVLAAGMMTLLVVFYEMRARGRGGTEVSPADAVRLINAGALVLDVRPGSEFADGHITRAKNVPADEIAQAADSLKKYRDKPVLTCDANGIHAARAAAQLRKLDFSKVFSLRGGLAAWKNEQYPLERNSGKAA